MASIETEKTGQIYRVYTGTSGGNENYDRLSFWSKAEDCQLGNSSENRTVANVLGTAKGVTSSYDTSLSESSDYIASIEAIKNAMDGIKLKVITQSEYDAIVTKSSNTLYIIT